MLSQSIEFAQKLIQFESVSHLSNVVVSEWVSNQLKGWGFEVEWIEYLDSRGVRKVSLVAKRGSGIGGVAYLAHTDVVPADDWGLDFCSPFQGVIQNGRLYGRGACDMKGSLACALTAVSSIAPEQQVAPIYFVVTADEEVGMQGAREVSQRSSFYREMVELGVVGLIGEPTELNVVHAHKGGTAIRISSAGKSAHSSTRDGVNANHRLIPILPFLYELYEECENNESLRNSLFSPPTLSWNIVLANEPAAMNVVPSRAEACVFFRSMPDVDHQGLLDRVQTAANELGLQVEVSERDHLYTSPDARSVQSMLKIVGKEQPTTVCYATDGSILNELQEKIVCGPGSIQQAHCCDEWISLDQLDRGTDVFRSAFEYWTCTA